MMDLENGYNNLVVSSDSLLAVQVIWRSEIPPWYTRTTMRAIKEMIPLFQSFTIDLSVRETNTCTDFLDFFVKHK